MTKYDWNYEELGFRSEKELQESIARVKHKAKADSLEYEIERRKKSQDLINGNGGIDLKAIEEGARLAELDRVVASKLHWEREAEKQKAEQEKLDKLLRAAAEKIMDEKKTKAEREMKEEKEKLQKELDQKIKNQYGLESKEEVERNEAYKGLLNGWGLDKE